MNKLFKNIFFKFCFCAGFILFAAINLLSFIRAFNICRYASYCDRYDVGFPYVMFKTYERYTEKTGLSNHYDVVWFSLIVDILITLIFSFLIGLILKLIWSKVAFRRLPLK